MMLPEKLVLKLMTRAYDRGHRQGAGEEPLYLTAMDTRDEYCKSLLEGTIEVVERREHSDASGV